MKSDLWAQECFNDVIEHGFKNDKLPLLYAANVSAQVAVRKNQEPQREYPWTKL